MATHINHLFAISRPNRSKRPIGQAAPGPPSPPLPNAHALEALARASAIGVYIPPSLLGRTYRQDMR